MYLTCKFYFLAFKTKKKPRKEFKLMKFLKNQKYFKQN